jgi:hypothetical protein
MLKQFQALRYTLQFFITFLFDLKLHFAFHYICVCEYAEASGQVVKLFKRP